MADFDRRVLDFYGISTPMPTTWPSEKNDKTDDSDSDREQQQKKKKLNRRKSRYEALERAVSNRSSVVAGSETSASGVSNLVQRDEPDPLGSSDSVVRTLKDLGVPIQDDPRLRNRFLLSSTSFSPALFLSQMHANADTRSLLGGLEVLSRSIDQKSASLKVLVESNFERFVRAKATIDNVYKEMKYRGAEPPTTPTARARAHSRHASRSSFRGSSGGATTLAANPLLSPTLGDSRKKNALVKESDYGVSGIKGPLLDVSAKAEDVWGPALGGREKEENLRTVSTCLSRYKEYIETSSNIADSIRRKDYDALVEEYHRARKFVDETKKLVEDLGSTPPSETQAYQVLIAARMWYDVEQQIELFKKEIWKKLSLLHNVSKTDTRGPAQDQHMELIGLLLELGVGAEDNPISTWLWTKYLSLKERIENVANRGMKEVEQHRLQLAAATKPSSQILTLYLRNLTRHAVGSKPHGLDTPAVIELWEKIVSFLSSLLSSQGILGEVLEFWQAVESFTSGKAQKSLPTGYNDESREHHRLSTQGTLQLRKCTIELVDMIRAHVFEFFTEGPPIVSPPNSPLPPNSPRSTTSAQPSPTSTRAPRPNLDPNNAALLSPNRDVSSEEIAFWPPSSNSISGVHYLSKMLGMVGTGAAEMASVVPVTQDNTKQIELLRTLVGVVRERCVESLCATWVKDAENMKLVENWQPLKGKGDVTCMPATFASFEGALLGGMQKILYVSEAIVKPGPRDIISAPPTKLLERVRGRYVSTLEIALSGMDENAKRPIKKASDEWTTDMDAPIGLNSARASVIARQGTIDASDGNVRLLLTLCNLQALTSQVVPNLNSQFESAFSVKLDTESENKIRDTLKAKDKTLFAEYIGPIVKSLNKIIIEGFNKPDWAPTSQPTGAGRYIYEVLLSLVLVHTQVSTTAPSLTEKVLKELLNQINIQILEVFKTRPKYDEFALAQAILELEFLALILTDYTSKASEKTQQKIYDMLESRTDNETRGRLKQIIEPLAEIKKRLSKESRTEFACFRQRHNESRNNRELKRTPTD
ncbi:exocyst complex component Sec5-domain-containing protein [Nemania sp. FL0031]|nr:exocyst complex component Sec5-domain-containing protein [Nemania sp. FL0031]